MNEQDISKVTKKQKATIKDLARLANTSVTAVSRALQHKDGVSEETGKRILELAEKHGYRPNLLAKNMRAAKSNIIGIIVGDITRTFFVELLRGVEEEARKQGMSVLISNANEDFENEKNAIENFLAYNCSGIIICPVSDHDDYLLKLKDEEVSIVLVDRPIQSDGSFNQVFFDNKIEAKRAVEYLLRNGHKNIACLSSLRPATTTLKKRIEGYKEALIEYGIKIREEYLHTCNDIQDLCDTVEKLLELPEKPTALFIADEPLAMPTVSTILRNGLSIPDDISVMIFGEPTWASSLPPGFSCISRPVREMGKQAVEMLAEQIRNRTNSKTSILPCTIIDRGSVMRIIKQNANQHFKEASDGRDFERI